MRTLVGRRAAVDRAPAEVRLEIGFASPEELEAIYRMRHRVYAIELRQHPTNPAGRLMDALDSFNHYLVALRNDAVIGFVSITPPGHGTYSIDKYFRRADLDITFDDGLFEVRILTVEPTYRRGPVAFLLMYAALRWVEHHGGTRIVAIGRSEVAGLYERVGLSRLGRTLRSGAVTYELMTASVADLRQRLPAFAKVLRRVAPQVRWSLTVPFESPPGAFHGGASHERLGAAPRAPVGSTVIAADVLDAWFDPAPGVRRVLTHDAVFLAAKSPPTYPAELQAAIAARTGVEPSAISVGAGLSDLIFRCLPRWVDRTSRALLIEPLYGEYRYVLERIVGCRVEAVRFDPGENAPAPELPPDVGSGEYDLVVLVDPNNPLGYRLDQGRFLDALAAAAPRTLFWVDRTYGPFANIDTSLEQLAAGSGNVVAAMSMSKAYALSGLRVGYLTGPPGLIKDAQLTAPPWGISRPAQAAALAALADPDYYRVRYRETAELAEELRAGLAALPGVRPRRGVANFVYCELDQPLDASTLTERCRAGGLYVRSLPTDSHLRWRALRVTVQARPIQVRMLQTLGEAVEQTWLARRAVSES